MRFLIFSDAHIGGRNPRSRLDNYYQSCLSKFEEILSLSKDCDFIISAGDLFDSPIVANTIVDDILDRIDSNKKDFFVIFGNHDLQGYNVEASKATSLAHMIRRSKYVKHLNEIEDSNIYIKGYDCQFSGEEKLKEEGLIHGKDKKSIAITHQFITIKPFHPQVSHIMAKDLKTNYDIVICSHFHSEFDKVINGTRFINLSSIGRTSINEQHPPQIAIINIDNLEIEKLQLKSAKPANDIFDLTKYEELKENERNIEDFISLLNSAKIQTCDIANQISLIGKENNVDKEVINYLLEKIGKEK